MIRGIILPLMILLAAVSGNLAQAEKIQDFPDPDTVTVQGVERSIADLEFWHKRKPPDIHKLLLKQGKKVRGERFTFAVIGDSYGRDVVVPLLRVAELSARVVLYTDVGDFVGNGIPWAPERDKVRGRKGRYYWDFTAQVTDPFFNRIPHLPTLGDHEYEGGGQEIKDKMARSVAFRRFWGLTSVNNAWRFKNCLFLTMDCWNRSDKQWAWLKKELDKAKADRTIQHVFISRHEPFYDIGKTGFGVSRNRSYRSNSLVRQFKDYKVTATFGGHQHAYYRTVRDRVTHIAVLACGAGRYGQKYRDKVQPGDSFFYLAGGDKKEGPAPPPLLRGPLPPKGKKLFRHNGKDFDLSKHGVTTLYENYICIIEINGPKAKHWLLHKNGTWKLGEISLKPLPGSTLK